MSPCIQEDDPSRGTWDLVLYCFHRLDGEASPYSVMLLFEIKFLREMGIWPDFSRCVKCMQEVAGEAFLDARSGGIYHGQCAAREYEGILSRGDLAVLRYYAGRELSAASKLSVKEEDARRIFGILHPFAVHHLGYEAKALRMLRL